MELPDKHKHSKSTSTVPSNTDTKDIEGKKKGNYVGGGHNRAAEGAEKLCFLSAEFSFADFFFARASTSSGVHVAERTRSGGSERSADLRA